MSKSIMIYLVSHASGELVEMLARNAVIQLEGVEVKRRLWKMVRRLDQLPEILSELAQAPGCVLHSISHNDVRETLEEGCRQLALPYQFALEPLIVLRLHADQQVSGATCRVGAGQSLASNAQHRVVGDTSRDGHRQRLFADDRSRSAARCTEVVDEAAVAVAARARRDSLQQPMLLLVMPAVSEMPGALAGLATAPHCTIVAAAAAARWADRRTVPAQTLLAPLCNAFERDL